ncbi:MAG: radical SAM protein [Gammaproteobacteria bacterium AqS3]|nr:radical SAM protein [Gammaproteobacteria bacterium AqS3]
MPLQPLVINFHIIENCNYACRFCYAHWGDPMKGMQMSDEEIERMLRSLAEYFRSKKFRAQAARMGIDSSRIRLNIAGGEPTLLPTERLLMIVKQAKSLGFEVSIISNASFPDRLVALAPHLQMIGISVDSIDEDTNRRIGRANKKGRGKVLTLDELGDLCIQLRAENPAIELKLNTVVCSENVGEDLHELIRRIRPDRWKIFKALPAIERIPGDILITDSPFQDFLDRHREFAPIISSEDNDEMQQSYIMINPEGRFFQNGGRGRDYRCSERILEVGAEQAFGQIPFSFEKFAARYPATRHGDALCSVQRPG